MLIGRQQGGNAVPQQEVIQLSRPWGMLLGHECEIVLES